MHAIHSVIGSILERKPETAVWEAG